MTPAGARALLAAHPVFEKGEGEDRNGTWVLLSDDLWEALLSLDSPAEFCEVASRMVWEMQPRGMYNVEPWERYGDAIVPWLATRLEGNTLVDHPWCIVPCLLACSSREAFELVWQVDQIAGRAVRKPVRTEWLDRHADVATGYLTELAARGDARAIAQLAAQRTRGGGPPPAATTSDILGILDATSLGLVAPELGLWPSERGVGPRTSHALRAVAIRDGVDWALALEQIQGDRSRGVYPARIAITAFGSRVGTRFSGVAQLERPLDVTGAPPSSEAFRSWLTARGDAVWGEIDPGLVGLPGGTIVATIPTLAHIDAGQLASRSPVYAALARALVESV